MMIDSLRDDSRTIRTTSDSRPSRTSTGNSARSTFATED